MPTTVINIKDAPPDWKDNPQYTYIGRPSLWGNPFKIGVDGSRKRVMSQYRNWLPGFRTHMGETFKHKLLGEIKDKILVCHCKPLFCHGDVLAELADNEY